MFMQDLLGCIGGGRDQEQSTSGSGRRGEPDLYGNELVAAPELDWDHVARLVTFGDGLS